MTKITLMPKQSRHVNSLIRKMCCNYDNGNCILLDDGEPCVCPQIITYSHIICKWFKSAILPLDKELYFELTKPANTVNCAICGKEFVKHGNRAKYCTDCRKKVLNKQKAAYIRKRRYGCRKLDT